MLRARGIGRLFHRLLHRSAMSLILASNSKIRRMMLEEAGIAFEVRTPAFDEDRVKRSGLEGEQLARTLAEGKAASVASAPGDSIIGSDSTVMVDGKRFSKPRDRDEAADHLRTFSGRTMLLSSAVALARQGHVEWSHVETARLHVRPLSEQFIAQYLDQEWPEVGHCVGVFRMEGRGVTLFDHVEGSHFTILGMPLIPLLGALRERGLIPA
ncbi:MAG: Maf family protein [Sphingomicrobium sp.]